MSKRIIKVTKEQLKETEGEAFKYLDANNDTPSSNGSSEIGVTGKTDDETYGTPVSGDKIANTLTPQGYNRYRMYGNNVIPGYVRESDENHDSVDDFYNNAELDTLSNRDSSDNLIKLPKGTDYKLDILIDNISKLQPKQQAMVLNKIMETIDLSNIPYSWAKELMHKILSRNNINK